MKILDEAAIVRAYADGATVKALATAHSVGVARIMRILDAAGYSDRRRRPRPKCGRDITGQRFGRLVAIKPTGARRGSNIEWEFACDCGSTLLSTPHAVGQGNTLSCGCLKFDRIAETQRKDIAGQRFGQLTAIEFARNVIKSNGNKGQAMWRFRCDCGAEVIAPGGSVAKRAQRDPMISCISCAAKRRAASRRVDYTGKRYGMLTGVRQLNPEAQPSHSRWLWQCDCGGTVERMVCNVVKSNRPPHCGCQPGGNVADRTGERFGALVALRNIGKRHGETTYTWEFQCDCGKICQARLRDAVSGLQKSCGCRQGGYDNVANWMDGEFRNAETPAVFYLFSLAKFPGYVKPGIAEDLEARIKGSRGQYGKVYDYLELPRIEAWLIEQAVLRATSSSAECPRPLVERKWEGFTEVRRMDPAEVWQLALSLHDQLQEHGRYEFALRFLQLLPGQRAAIECRLTSTH